MEDETTQVANVVAIGNNVENVQVGDKVIFENLRRNSRIGQELNIEGKDFIILDVDNIMGIM